MNTIEIYKARERELRQIELARLSLRHFIAHIFPNYTFTFAHDMIIETIEAIILGHINKAMVCVPPQIGKSTIVSKIAPIWAAGQDINERISVISYSVNLAAKFNKEAQRYYTSDAYREVFPHNYAKKNAPFKNLVAAQKSDLFDFVDSSGNVRGAYSSFGIAGGITGQSVSLCIMDDTIKNAEQAFSLTRRNKDWDTFTTSIKSRMVSGGRIISTATPWHKDDLQNRILAQADANEWEKVFIPALKQNKPVTIENDLWKFELSEIFNKDPRQEGESIWELQRPKQELIKLKELDPFVFEAMYQVQPPSARTGGQMWLHALQKREHIFMDLPKERGGQYVVSFDNNLDPVSAVVCWFLQEQDPTKSKLWILREYQIGYIRTDGKKVPYAQSETPIEDICSAIKKEFGAPVYIITGDAALNNRAHGLRGGNPTSIIRSNLNGANKIPSHNLGLASSNLLCNRVIMLDNLRISKKCTRLWEEMNSAQSTSDLDIIKDRGSFMLDLFDGMRYAIHLCFDKVKLT